MYNSEEFLVNIFLDIFTKEKNAVGRRVKLMNGDSSIFVIILGLATTFIGLICIILLAKIMSFCCIIAGKAKKSTSNNAPSAPTQSAVQPAAPKGEQIPNRGEFVAAISAAIAEDMGKDVSSIRILSIKRI